MSYVYKRNSKISLLLFAKDDSINISLHKITYLYILMQKYIIYILLLVHVNTSIFIPQLDEVDQFDANSMQLDDINSLYEYINEIVLDNKDFTPEDEDDDSARYFHVVKFHYYALQCIITLKRPNLFTRSLVKRQKVKEEKISFVFIEIPSPPPRA